MPNHPFDLLLVDIDGTLTIDSGWKYYASQLGRTAEYERANAEYLAGRRMEDDHLRELLRLVEGVPLPHLESLLERTPKLSGISEAVHSLRAESVTPVLLSHNPGYVSDWYARRFGFADWEGTNHRPDPEVIDGVIGPPNGIVADKLGGVRRLLARHPTPLYRVAHLGDARADVAVFRLVGFGVAVNTTLPEVASAADLAIRISDLREVLGPLRAARPRSPGQANL